MASDFPTPSSEVIERVCAAHEVQVGTDQVDVGGSVITGGIDAVDGDVGVVATGLAPFPCKRDRGQGAQAVLCMEDCEHVVCRNFELDVGRSSSPSHTKRGYVAEDEGFGIGFVTDTAGVLAARSTGASPPSYFTRPAPLIFKITYGFGCVAGAASPPLLHLLGGLAFACVAIVSRWFFRLVRH